MKKKILFVDDEPNILEGLQRMLRSMRHEWDMEFAESGEKGLEIMKGSSDFDVVVSDMRMPGMDGIQFLTEVMKSHPSAIRLVLSGQMEKEIGLKAVRVANQCLWKPTNAEALKLAITRAYTLRNRLSNKSLQKLISNLESLPSIPTLYTELREEITTSEPSIKKLGKIISKDMGMTSKILQLVNSSFFGIARTISDPAEAVTILGIELISLLVLSIKIFSEYKNNRVPKFSINSLWEHSLTTSLYAKIIAKQEKKNKDIIEGCFLAGLLHDIGKLILIINLPEKYAQVIELVESGNMKSWEVEREVFGATHGEVGASLLGTWGLPDPVVEAVAFHHFPSEFPGSQFRPLTAVHIANIIASNTNSSKEEIISLTDMNYLERCNSAGQIHLWMDACKSAEVEGINL